MTLTVLAAISLSLPLVFGEETKASPDQDKSNDFWNSVYEDNYVVEIDISLTKEAWESMQPTQTERGRGGPPRGGVLPDGPPRGRSGRPDGPLSEFEPGTLSCRLGRSLSGTFPWLNFLLQHVPPVRKLFPLENV